MDRTEKDYVRYPLVSHCTWEDDDSGTIGSEVFIDDVANSVVIATSLTRTRRQVLLVAARRLRRMAAELEAAVATMPGDR